MDIKDIDIDELKNKIEQIKALLNEIYKIAAFTANFEFELQVNRQRYKNLYED